MRIRTSFCWSAAHARGANFLRRILAIGGIVFPLVACGSEVDSPDIGDFSSEQASDVTTPTPTAVYTDVSVDLDRAVSEAERNSIQRYRSLFPTALSVPPIIDSSGNLPGWHDISPAGFSRRVYPSQNPPLKTDPHFFQFEELPENHGYSLQNLLTYVHRQSGLPAIDSTSFVDIEGWTQLFGVGLRASFKAVSFKGKEIHWFIDVLGIRADGTMLINMIYAEAAVFDSWDGILLPLVFNGHVKDPSIFTNREVFTAGTFDQKTQFYAAVVNTNLQTQYDILVSLSEGAQQAVSNAVTISECAVASNCNIYYVNGRAVANYD